MDSDAFMGVNFISNLLATFDADPDIALHVDEVRNIDRRHYPFDFPPVQEVLVGECVNWNGTTTMGLIDNSTQLYTRNYGACFCAKREAIIAIGGADEHIDYMGHVCGPYDLTFRLVNAGKHELWHPTEFIYHCWHPGTDGENNYLGPHDGRNNSTRALKARATGRHLPYVENLAIQRLRLGNGRSTSFEELKPLLLPSETTATWRFSEEKRQVSLCRQAYHGSRWSEAIQLFQDMPAKPDSPDFLAEMARALHILGKKTKPCSFCVSYSNNLPAINSPTTSWDGCCFLLAKGLKPSPGSTWPFAGHRCFHPTSCWRPYAAGPTRCSLRAAGPKRCRTWSAPAASAM